MTEYTDIKGRIHPISETEPVKRDAAETEQLLDELRRLLAHTEV